MNIYITVITASLLFGATLVCFMSKNIVWGVICIIFIVCIFFAESIKVGPGLVFEFKRRIDNIEKSLESLSKTINDIYLSFITERITASDLNSRLSVVELGKDKYAYIFKLRYTPIINSIDLLWGIAYQPPDTYKIVNNLLIFSSKEGLSSLQHDLYNRFVIRYFKNTKQGKILELNDIEIKDKNYFIKSLNRTFKPEDFIEQSVIFE